MDLHLAGLRALVTGGTRGIGRAIVEEFLAEGASVAFCARDADAVKEVQDALAVDGATVRGSALDVADAEALTTWVTSSAEAMGGLDIVVSNVSALAIEDKPENWTSSFEVDLMAAVRIVNAALPYLEASSAASIVAVSSVSGREIDFAAGPYGTIKAALIHYMQGLAHQLADKGIRANSVSPGNTYFAGGVWANIEQNLPELFSTAMALNPTGRMGTPDEIARTAVFLSSPASSRTSGANILVDGALTRGVQF
ncbi:MAG TPA: SDR family oxidoreductase [Mycobacterium sp.]|jgi:NAD(P)-dependent dehydrogenase (short-subunit alcohol dehydrogenase family)|nr:SDR family oxidoreductase [Mycobacterium sp.]